MDTDLLKKIISVILLIIFCMLELYMFVAEIILFCVGLAREGILVSEFIVLCLQVLPIIVTIFQFALNREYARTQVGFIIAVVGLGGILSMGGFIFYPKLF